MKKARIISALLTISMLTTPASMPAVRAGEVKPSSEALTGIVTQIIGDVRIQVLSPTLVRLEEKGPKGFEDRKTFHIVNRTDWAGDTVTKTEDGDSVILETSSITIRVKKDADDLSAVKIFSGDDSILWQYTGLTGNKVALPKANEPTYAWEITDTPRIIPAEWGFSPQPDESTENRSTNGWDLSNDAPDMYIFLPDNDHRQLRRDFVSLTGQTEMLPLSALGAWDSRYYAYSEQTALAQIDGYHSRNLPLDYLVIDTDWRDASSGVGYTVNTSLFPDMRGFVQKAHDKNVELIFNDHPEPTSTNGTQNNVLVPDEVNYRFTNLTDILKLGVDSWWYDRNWWTTLKPMDGFTHEVIGMAVYANAAKSVYPNRRLMMMSNVDGVHNGTVTGASNIAAHRYGIQWTGDTSGRQETILQEISTFVNRGETGALPYVSTDLMAHQTLSQWITDAEYLRWVQMGALSPTYRPHVTSNDMGRMPWLRGEEVTDITRDYVNMRYRLLPVFYQLSHENYETGMPMLRSMTFDYPDYAGADAEDQYLLGEDILAAPVIQDTEYHSLPAEWVKNGEVNGFKAEYFGNTDLSGTPALTQTVSSVEFDWKQGGPGGSVGSDNFSARYTGTVTVGGDEDIQLTTNTDDGCRLYVDGALVLDLWKDQGSAFRPSSFVMQHGKSYEVVFEYYEKGGEAACKLGYEYGTELSEERTVWIPEGEWINTFTGETVYGPKSIEMQCNLTQMPLFVKKGAIIPLADEMLTTKDKDWSHLTLDVYPSTRQSDRTQLYEDDTESTDYQKGLFRTTELSAGFEDGKATVQINPAQGNFSGDRAFKNRSWTIRVHQPEGWGALKKVTCGGKELSFTAAAKDADAMPFSVTGGSSDAVVYEIQLTASVTAKKVLQLEFASPVDPEIPDGEYDEPICTGDYGIGDFKIAPVTRTVDVTDQMPVSVNLTEEGSSDWLFPLDSIRKKSDAAPQFTCVFPESLQGMYDYYTAFSWSDGTGSPQTATHNGTCVNGLNQAYQMKVAADTSERELTLYIGAWSGTGRLEIFDGTDGDVVNTYEVPAPDGTSFYRKVTIQLKAEEKTQLYLRYTLISKLNDGGNITFAAATLKRVGTIVKTVTKAAAPDSVNITEQGTADWLAAGSLSDSSVVTKAGVIPQISLQLPQSGLSSVHDFTTAFSWADGNENQPSAASVKSGIACEALNGGFTLTVPADENRRDLTLYLGGRNSTGKLEITDETQSGNPQEILLGGGTGSYANKVVIQFSSEAPATLHVRYVLQAKNGSDGSCIFAGATLKQEVSLQLKTNLSYPKDGWSAKDIMISLSASANVTAKNYQIKQQDGWEPIDGDSYIISQNGIFDLEFRYVDPSGNTGVSKSITVKKDSIRPAFTLSKTIDGDNLEVTPHVISRNVSDVTVCYQADGGRWIALETGTLTLSRNPDSVYRFKAVSGAGLESGVLLLNQEANRGDMNDDGEITASDVVALRAAIAAGHPSEEQIAAGDMDGDQQLTEEDVAALLEELGLTLGDVNGDNQVGALDIMVMRKALLNGNATDEQLAAGDLDGNGALGPVDIMKLRKLLLQMS